MPPLRELQTLRGRAESGTVHRGTSSEHEGVVLITPHGERLVLERVGSRPFNDPATRALAGHTIEVDGYRLGSRVRYIDVRIID